MTPGSSGRHDRGSGFVMAPAFRCGDPWSNTFWFRPPRNAREFGSRAPDQAPGALLIRSILA